MPSGSGSRSGARSGADWAWGALAVFAAVSVVVGAAAGLTDLLRGELSGVLRLAWTVAWAWIAAGAWRRTVWGRPGR